VQCCFFSRGYKSIDVLAGDTRTTGGAEAQITYLASALAQMGHDVGLIYGEGTGRSEPHVVGGITCIDAAPLWSRPQSLLKFWQAMSFLSPDLLYARLPSDFVWMMGLFAKCRSGAKFVYALADDRHCNPWRVYDDVPHTFFHGAAYALGLRSADAIAFQHADQVRLVGPHLQSRMVHIPNLVRSFREEPRPFNTTTYDAIWIATMRAEKQVEIFLDLTEALPDFRFALVGNFCPDMSADQNKALEQRIHSLSNLDYLGPQRAPEIMSLLSRSRVLVNTSLAEGFPNTMLEAWSVGVPVVSLSVDPGGVIRREQLGLVSGNRDALQGDIRKVACSETLNWQTGKRALDYVRRKHSRGAVFEALSKIVPSIDYSSAITQVP
jgi:glycosyltransferase involved in cell wall biosynthesis